MAAIVPVAKGGYWLIETILDVTAPLPAEITPDVRLERATDEQIETLKSRVARPISEGREQILVVVERTATSTSSVPRNLPREKWRYFVLTFRGGDGALVDLYRLCRVVDPPFDFSVTVHTTLEFGRGEPFGWGYPAPSPDITTPPVEPVPVITAETIETLRATVSRLAAIKADHPDVQRAINMLHDLRRVAQSSPLYILGLFAVLELLLTHNPQDKENADSLSHQLSTKIPLLDRRLPTSLDYGSLVAAGPAERVWKKLYAYRSTIAHGGVPDYAREFRFLKSQKTAREFVEQVCRKLLRFALSEPDLIRDLKAV